jgi:hypothetical protein
MERPQLNKLEFQKADVFLDNFSEVKHFREMPETEA